MADFLLSATPFSYRLGEVPVIICRSYGTICHRWVKLLTIRYLVSFILPLHHQSIEKAMTIAIVLT